MPAAKFSSSVSPPVAVVCTSAQCQLRPSAMPSQARQAPPSTRSQKELSLAVGAITRAQMR